MIDVRDVDRRATTGRDGKARREFEPIHVVDLHVPRF
jgi:hypothetical protein